MADVDHVISAVQHSMDIAEESESIDSTIFHSNHAIILVLCAILREISDLRNDLARLQTG